MEERRVIHGVSVERTAIDGVLAITSKETSDHRGFGGKVIDHDAFEELGVPCGVDHSFYLASDRHVVRALHYQEEPHGQAKFVHCLHGAVYDVAVETPLVESPALNERVGLRVLLKLETMQRVGAFIGIRDRERRLKSLF